MPKRLVESQAFASAPTDTPGRLQLQLITPGWGSSGYYSRQVLENAASDKVWPAGTHIYFDHPTESEMVDRPERSVRDLAAVLSEDARTDSAGGLVAEADIIGPYRELMTDETFMRSVGMSIRATGDGTVGEAEGRKGTIVTRLIEGQSVDVVTKAGRGGKILAAIESTRATMASEASSEDTRDRLNRAVRAANEGEWTYVMDFDAEQGVVWFEGDEGLYEQGYELTDDAATLTGDPVEVRRVVTYPRASSTAATGSGSDSDIEESLQPPVIPAGSTTHTPHSEEENMGTTQIEESRLASLEADASRVPTLEEAARVAEQRADSAEVRAMAAENRETAREVISESGHQFSRLERAGLLAALPVVESGELDREAFTEAVTTAAAESARASGAGSVRGFGEQLDESGDGYGVEDFDATFNTAKEA